MNVLLLKLLPRTLANDQLDAQIFNTFITILYVSRNINKMQLCNRIYYSTVY